MAVRGLWMAPATILLLFYFLQGGGCLAVVDNSKEVNESAYSIPLQTEFSSSGSFEDKLSPNFNFGAVTSDKKAGEESKIENDMESMLHWAITNSDPEELKEKAKQVKDLSEEELRVKRQHIRDLMEAMKMPSDSEMMNVSIKDINNHTLPKERVLRALHELSVLVEPIDNANDLHNLGGLLALKNILGHTEAEVRTMAVIVIGKAAQNNPTVQNQVIETGILKELMLMIRNPDSANEEKAKIFYAISGCIRTNIAAQRTFYDLNGFDLLSQILNNPKSDIQILRKVIFLIADLSDQFPKEEKVLKSKSNTQSNQKIGEESNVDSSDDPSRIMGALPGAVVSGSGETGLGLAMLKSILTTSGMKDDGEDETTSENHLGITERKDLSTGGVHIDHFDKPIPLDIAESNAPEDGSGIAPMIGAHGDSIPGELENLISSSAVAGGFSFQGGSSESMESSTQIENETDHAKSTPSDLSNKFLHSNVEILQSIVNLIHSRDDLDLHEKILITLTSLIDSGGKTTQTLLIHECKLKHHLSELGNKIISRRKADEEFAEYLDDIEKLRQELITLL